LEKIDGEKFVTLALSFSQCIQMRTRFSPPDLAEKKVGNSIKKLFPECYFKKIIGL
jgi:hypothetical protein